MQGFVEISFTEQKKPINVQHKQQLTEHMASKGYAKKMSKTLSPKEVLTAL